LLKLVSPGIPDVYQGQELWDFSLVDPDNRRPVDYHLRAHLLGELQQGWAEGSQRMAELAELFAKYPQDNRAKLLVTWAALRFREQNRELFSDGAYVPLFAQGPQAEHVCAFARKIEHVQGDRTSLAIAIVPRLVARLTPLEEGQSTTRPPLGSDVWNDTLLPLADVGSPSLTNVFTGEKVKPTGGHLALAKALAKFPVALLVNSHAVGNG
jgi:(1->4)-alpha-D-glucan 1-alpha-D-glucosylmutase